VLAVSTSSTDAIAGAGFSRCRGGKLLENENEFGAG
jgi:hypothetical protein